MRQRLYVVLIAVALGAGVALAAQLGPIQVQSEQSTTVSTGGQTLDVYAVGVSVVVEFDLVNNDLVRGRVRRLSGTTGTCRIFWREKQKERLVPIVGQQEEQFSLEGGDTDKKSGGIVN